MPYLKISTILSILLPDIWCPENETGYSAGYWIKKKLDIWLAGYLVQPYTLCTHIFKWLTLGTFLYKKCIISEVKMALLQSNFGSVNDICRHGSSLYRISARSSGTSFHRFSTATLRSNGVIPTLRGVQNKCSNIRCIHTTKSRKITSNESHAIL